MPAGRPLKYKQPAKINKICEEYFNKCDKDKEPYTITGLALALDISRNTLLEYSKRPEYQDTIKRHKQRVEADYEKSLRKRGNAGDIFGLKNFGWQDKQVQEVHNINDKTSEELQEKLEQIRKEALKSED